MIPLVYMEENGQTHSQCEVEAKGKLLHVVNHFDVEERLVLKISDDLLIKIPNKILDSEAKTIHALFILN